MTYINAMLIDGMKYTYRFSNKHKLIPTVFMEFKLNKHIVFSDLLEKLFNDSFAFEF